MNQKIKMFFPVIIYMAVCLLTLAWFWLGVSGSDMLGFVFVEFYLILPITTVICSVWIGINGSGGKARWIVPIFFGLMYMLMGYATFSIAETITIASRDVQVPSVYAMFPGFISSLAGLMIGIAGRRIMDKRGLR